MRTVMASSKMLQRGNKVDSKTDEPEYVITHNVFEIGYKAITFTFTSHSLIKRNEPFDTVDTFSLKENQLIEMNY